MTSVKRLFLMLMTLSLGIALSCRLDVPIKEMMQARTTINKARLVLAEKYDPENLGKAVAELYKCHDHIKNEKASDARKSAVTSYELALKAYETSLPRAAEDTLAEAKQLYQKADELLADKFAPVQFTAAKNAIADAETQKAKPDLWNSFLKSKEAVAAGKEAVDMSLKQSASLVEKNARIKKELDELKSQNIPEKTQQDLAAASSSLDKAAEYISKNNFKQAVLIMDESEKTLATAKSALMKQSLKDRIAALRKEVDQLKIERGVEFAGDDIDIVLTRLNEAESLLEQGSTDDARQKVTEAENSLNQARQKTTRGIALARAASVQKLIDEAKQKDKKNKFKEAITRAEGMHAEGKTMIDGGSFKESLVKFGEAEALINSLGIAGEKDIIGSETGFRDGSGLRVYKVIYNKKKRDCLWRIAGTVYKDARLWPLIYVANRDQIKDPDLIFPGQKFIIPEIPTRKKDKTAGDGEAKKEEKIDDADKKSGDTSGNDPGKKDNASGSPDGSTKED